MTSVLEQIVIKQVVNDEPHTAHYFCTYCQWPGDGVPGVGITACGQRVVIEGVRSGPEDKDCDECLKLRGFWQCPLCGRCSMNG